MLKLSRRRCIVIAAVVFLLCGCCSAATRLKNVTLDKPIVGKAFDGGQVRFDGVFYDFRAANGIQMLKMWVPPGADPVRGVLFHGNPGGHGDTRNIPRDERLQEFAARYDFGIIGVTSFFGTQIYPKLGKIIVEVMNDWAKLGRHPEIANLPIIARGSSNAGMTAYGLACYAPERMICFTPNVGARYNPVSPPDEALKVPALLHIGPEDKLVRGGVERTEKLFADIRPRGALWAWDAENGKGHEIGHIDDIDMKFYEVCIALRLPADADPRKGPVQLNELPEESGWLVDFSSWASGITRIAPYNEYEADKSKAGWVPNKDIAFLYRGVATYDNPLKVSIRDLGPVDNPFASGRLLRSVGGNVVDPGRKIILECDASGFADRTRIEFYHGGRKISEVTKGREPKCEFVVDPKYTTYALTAVGYDDKGTVRTATPTHFLVRDPQVSSALADQRASTERVFLRTSRPQYGSSATGKSQSKADPADKVLLAYGVTAEQEKQFAADDKVTPFWKMITEERDYVRLNVAEHLGERGNSYKSARSTGDAEVLVKAARSRAGLYLYFEASDDEWSEPDDLFDAIDVHFSRHSAAQIASAEPSTMFMKMMNWSITLSWTQFQINFGTEERPANLVKRNFPDPWDSRRAEDTFEDAANKHGIIVDIITLSKDTKVMELFIPWDYVGFGPALDEPPTGHRLGLCLGYNDRDPGEHKGGDFDRLRWPSGVDPWWNEAVKGLDPNPYGDLEMGPMLE